MTRKGMMWFMAALLAMSSCSKEDNPQDSDKDRDTEEGPAAEINIFPDLEYDELVFVEGGTFFMGAQDRNPNEVNYDAAAASSEESPVHEVTLDSYYIGKYEVTQKLWKKVMGVNPSTYRGDDLPVEYISWNDCQEFVAKLNEMTGKNFRLPTEAEWEYAARGGQQDEYTRTRGQSGTYYKYAGSNDIEEVAWYNINDPNNKTHKVGSKAPNALGLYDMSGNVYEWCSDWFGSYSSTPETNPTGPSSGSARVLRGGSYYYDDYYNRVSYRIGIAATLDRRRQYYGVRIVLPLN